MRRHEPNRYQMGTREKARYAYCITAALASVGILALTLLEAIGVLTTMRNRYARHTGADREF